MGTSSALTGATGATQKPTIWCAHSRGTKSLSARPITSSPSRANMRSMAGLASASRPWSSSSAMPAWAWS